MKVTVSPAVLRALAHPVRRRLVELLSDRPRTTGDLAVGFAVSRFAVMKHLAVLQRAGLVAVRREGRERWNALTADPSTALGAIEYRAPVGAESIPKSEAPLKPDATAVGPGERSDGDVSSFHLEQTVDLAASPAQVFDALTVNVAAWWGAPYLRSAEAARVLLEPQLGGRLYEEWGHRQGFIRGIVTAIRQDDRLEITGRIAGNEPLPAVLEIVLAAGRGRTHLALSHRGVATSSSAAAHSAAVYAAAWEDLVGARLKAFVEDGTRSGIAERQPAADAAYGWF